MMSMGWILGVRPTFRFNIQLERVEFQTGIGFGVQHFATSGEWTKKATDFEGEPSGAPGDEDTIRYHQSVLYSFEQSSLGLYSVMDMAGYYRFIDDRFGAGVFMSVTVPLMNINGSNPSVKIEEDTGVYLEEQHVNLVPEDEIPASLFEAEKGDYRNTVVRHLSSMYLFTLGLTLDMRF